MDTTPANVFDIKTLKASGATLEDDTLAHVLVRLRGFQESLMTARRLSGITGKVDFPATFNGYDFTQLIEDETPEAQSALSTWAHATIKEYKLSKEWIIPLVILVITNCLMVPEDNAIVLVPSYGNESTILDMLNVGTYNKSEYPVIAFKYAISRKELQKYLSEHEDEYEKLMRGLPKKRRTSAEKRSITIGHIIWLLKVSDPELPYKDIADSIEHDSKLSKLVGGDKSEILDEILLRNYHNSFLKAMSSI